VPIDPCGQHNDRHFLPFSQLLQEHEAVNARKHHIEDYQVVPTLQRACESIAAVACNYRLVTFFTEGDRDVLSGSRPCASEREFPWFGGTTLGCEA